MLNVYDHNESVCCQKVRLALYEKGIEFNNIHIAIEEGVQYQDEYLAINPSAVVPAIEHRGKVITESTIISEYINEAFDGPNLMPTDPYCRSQKRRWSRKIDDSIHLPHTTSLSFVIALRFIFQDSLNTPEKLQEHLRNVRNPESKEIQKQAFEQGYESEKFIAAVLAFHDMLADMENSLSESNWLAGSQLSLADLDVAPYIHRLESLSLEGMWSDLPRVTDWYKRITARESWGKAIKAEHIEKWVQLMSKTGLDAQQPVSDILRQYR